METRPRLATPLPPTATTATATTACLHPASLLDLADELWFSSSVLPFPSFSDLPCLPLFSSLFSSSPDPSTLLAQLMFSTSLSRPPPSSISSSSSSSPFLPPSLQQTPLPHSPWDLPAYLTLPSPSDGKDVQSYGEDEDAYHRVHSHGNACSYGRIQDPYPAQVGSRRDKDAYAEYAYAAHCYVEDGDAHPAPGYGNAGPAPSYDTDEDAYPALADNEENAGHADTIGEQQQEVQDCEHADIPVFSGDLDAEDALPGIYDVGVFLKDQYHKQRGDTQHKGRQDVLDAVCPESSPRRAGPFQYGGEGKNVKANVGNAKTSIGNRELNTTAIAPHVTMRNMGIREPDMTGMAPHVAKTNLGNRELFMADMAPNVARSMLKDGRHDMGNRELDTISMAPHVARSMLNDGRRDNSLTLSYVPIHKKILPIMSALPSVQVLSCNEQAEVKEHLKLWAHVVASKVHLKAELRAKRVL